MALTGKLIKKPVENLGVGRHGRTIFISAEDDLLPSSVDAIKHMRSNGFCAWRVPSRAPESHLGNLSSRLWSSGRPSCHGWLFAIARILARVPLAADLSSHPFGAPQGTVQTLGHPRPADICRPATPATSFARQLDHNVVNRYARVLSNA